MAYKQKHQYGFRDSLEKGDPEKVIYGQYFDDEFKSIEEAIEAIDPDSDGNVDINEIDGLQDALDGKADKDHTHDEYLTDAPNDGKQYVRESEAWAEVTIPEAGIDEPTSDGKPYSRQVEGGQTVGAWVEAPTTDDIEYLDGRIDAIEGNISGGGGFIEAPDDGDDYARNGKSPAWVKTYNADYIDALEADYKNADAGKADKVHNHAIGDVTGLQPALDGKADASHNHDGDYAPANHTHTTDEITGLDDKITDIEGDITDLEGAVGELTGQLAMGGSYNASTGLVVTANLSSFTAGQPLPDYSTVPNTFVIVVEAGNNPEALSEGDWLVAGQSGWVAIKYGTAGSVDWDNITNVPDFDLVYAPIDHTHEIADVDGLQEALDAATGELEDGTIDGQITTWNASRGEWTPEDAVVVDANGQVGIGGTPSRSTKEIEEEAEATLRNWNSKDKKPTKAELIKKLAERTIGGGDSKLQVAGDIFTSGNITVKDNAGNSRNLYNRATDMVGSAGFNCTFYEGYFSGDITTEVGVYGRRNSGNTKLKMLGYVPGTDDVEVVTSQALKFNDTGGKTILNLDMNSEEATFSGGMTANTGYFSRASKLDGSDKAIVYAVAHAGADSAARTFRALDIDGNELFYANVSGDIWAKNKVYGSEGHFSGTIYGTVDDVPSHVKAITPTQIANWDAGTGGGGGGANIDGRISDTQITNWDTAHGWGNHASAGYAKGSFVPTSGNTTISGTLTATDFVATSDARLKQNATTAPVGLVDQLRGVEFEWKEDGRQDAGVIAQEVEKVLPHLVHDTGEHKAVNYNGLVAYLIEEIKDLKAQVEALK